MRVAHIFRLGVKELRSLFRDRMMMVFVFYAFSLAIYAAATGMPETLNHAAIAVVDEDRSQLSERIIDAFQPPYFSRPRIITLSEMDARMDAGLDTFALSIPPKFQHDVLAGDQPTIQLNIDATRMTQAFTGNNYVQTIIQEEAAAFVDRHRSVTDLPVNLVLRARFNPTLNHAWFGSIMEIINNVTLLSIVLTGAALIREREHGTIEHLLVMPLTPAEIMLSKIWSMGLVVLVACAFALLFIVQGFLQVPIEGSIPLFLTGAALHLFATTSLGIFLATLARSMPQFGLLLILTLLPLELLSGGTTPRESMPEFVQTIMLAAPNTHFVSLAQAILYRGAGFSIVWPQFLALIGIGAALFALSLARFRRSITTMA
ncbi:ABC transporter permease [Methyloligella sp. 2.7D]|uniref:ABC transporter permease n=1 Tax=unclassified Methyloligella TaxID=2625955 RepID=UPI00157CECC8|nr:ABC transporter permease [Methyloligella sp. GL2]QKP76617.1 ABC transporter permease [Methyloligella sp. GL2]